MKSFAPAAFVAGFVLAISSRTAFAQGSADSGKAIFAGRCGACHYVEKVRGDALGANLDGFFGRKAASEETYKNLYSIALRNSGLTWDTATLDKWLAGPAALVPGTRMAGFRGIASEAQRADLIAYLSTLK